MNEPLQGEEYTDFIRRIRLGDERAAEELIRRVRARDPARDPHLAPAPRPEAAAGV